MSIADAEFPAVTLSAELWATVQEGIDEAIALFSDHNVAMDLDRVRRLTEARDEIKAQANIPGVNHG